VVDTSGEGFRHAVEAGPWMIKPNADELGEFVGEKLETSGPEAGGAIVRAARSLMQRYRITSVVVSMGKEGAIYLEGDETILAVPPPVEVKSTVGAGDAMVAGTVAGKPWFSLAGAPAPRRSRRPPSAHRARLPSMRRLSPATLRSGAYQGVKSGLHHKG
jgi:hypothetical protein